ncbi:MAG: hypothetical protein MJ085_05175 [Clostridia bacterium]|nr:hypothetical protein [Clostridia bacterium]
MQEEIFRKKSLDKVKSPETLDDYIHVSNPGVWLVLVSIIVLLIGAGVWGIFGHIDSTVPSTVCVENGKAVCYVAENDIASVRTGMTVKYAGCEAVIDKIGEKGDMGYLCELTTESSAADGFYKGKVVLESYKPLSFVLN